MLLGGGLTVSEPVTLPFLPELNSPVALTGPLTVVADSVRVADLRLGAFGGHLCSCGGSGSS
jgi:hypothetical protein